MAADGRTAAVHGCGKAQFLTRTGDCEQMYCNARESGVSLEAPPPTPECEDQGGKAKHRSEKEQRGGREEVTEV